VQILVIENRPILRTVNRDGSRLTEIRPVNEESIFAAALGKAPTPERGAFLDEACAGDANLRAAVEALLYAHDHPDRFLDAPSAGLLATVDEPVREGPGTVIGPYKLLEQIGEGGFGVVFMAEQQHPVRRKVALKVIKPGMDTRQVIARFEAERQALALMEHPNIARVLDAGTTGEARGAGGPPARDRLGNEDAGGPPAPRGRPYFVMELVRGLSMTDYCDQHNLPVRERLELFLDVCQAVQHAHQKGIIHRDIKPSNVLVTLHDGKPVVKVIDFGIAKAMGQQLTEKTLFTSFAQMIGTPLYMSPEQAEMTGLDTDTRSDIYSLGVLLYELLTGTTPFDKERLKKAGFDEIRRIIREEEPPKPSTRMSTVGQAASTASEKRQSDPRKLSRLFRGELDWIVMKALEKDRNRRYETASAFAADVGRYLKDEPVQACPPSATYRLRKFARRNKGPLLAAGLVLLALIGGVIGAAYGSIEAWKQREVTALWQQAELERDGAEIARGEAESARDGETKAKREVEAAREKLAAVEYGRTIQVAYQEWRENNVPAALALLGNTRADLRGWEWRYVHHLCHPEVLTLREKTLVYSASFSPDGSRMLTASEDGTAKVRDAKTGAEVLTLKGHPFLVISASFSPDGSRVVTASADRTAKVWNAETGAEVLTLQGHTSVVFSASFSPDGSRVVTASEDRTAKVWDAKTGAEVLTLQGHTSVVFSASFSPDGSRVVTASEDGTAKVWDAKTGAEVLTLRGHTGAVTSASFSRDGSRVVTGSADLTANVWDAKTGVRVHSLKGHTDRVSSASFSPDGSRVLTGAYDRTAKVWDAKTGAEVVTLKGHANAVMSASFSRDGSRVVTSCADATVKVWDPKKQTEVVTLKGHTNAVMAASFSPDGTHVLTGGDDGTAKVWDAKTGATVLTLNMPTGFVHSASFSPDGKRIVTGGGHPLRRDKHAGEVIVWDAQSGQQTLSLPGHTRWVRSVAFSPDGSRIVTGGDCTARVWDAKTGANVLTLTLEGRADAVKSASFSPDGSLVVTTGSIDLATMKGSAKVWNAKTGAEILTLTGHKGGLSAASFSPDGSRLVTASEDGTAKVWDTKTGAELLTLQGHTSEVLSASFSPDGSRVVTASEERTAKVWDAKTGAEVLTLRHLGAISVASFSGDGSRIVTGSYDGTAKVWDATALP
jgi:WD40 repeat protein/serine/threonine protein kinase